MGHEFFLFLPDSNNLRSGQTLPDELKPKAPKETVRRDQEWGFRGIREQKTPSHPRCNGRCQSLRAVRGPRSSGSHTDQESPPQSSGVHLSATCHRQRISKFCHCLRLGSMLAPPLCASIFSAGSAAI